MERKASVRSVANDAPATHETEEPQTDKGAEPRSGSPLAGSGSPLLDKEYGNVPRERPFPEWTRKHWLIRRTILDRLRLWQWNGYQSLWVTLTSAPGSPIDRLRGDFQVLRKRASRKLAFGLFEYVCVDTLEGHGVLHMIWAYKDPDPRKRASFFVSFDWLQAQWNEIHGAFHVNIKRIGMKDKDALRLARYIVAQYCGDQDGLVRMSQSKMPFPLTKMRCCLLREMRNMAERYQIAHTWGEIPMEEFSRRFNSLFWGSFRSSWDELLTKRFCTVFGVQLAWLEDKIVRI